MTILVTGATGNVGNQIVRQLAEAGHPVRALTRDTSRATFPTGVDVVTGDLTKPETLTEALKDITALHLIAFAGDNFEELSTAAEVLALAKEQGATRVSVLGGPTSAAVEDAARASGMAATALHPVEFMSNMKDYARQVRENAKIADGFADSRSAMVHEADIAAVAIAALTGDGHDGQTYVLTGPEVLTTRGKVDVIARVLDRELPFTELSEAEFTAVLVAQGWDEGAAGWMVDVRKNTPEIGYTVVDTVERVTGRPARTFADWCRENVALFA